LPRPALGPSSERRRYLQRDGPTAHSVSRPYASLRYSNVRCPCAPTSHILHELKFELLSFRETIEYTPRQRPVMKEDFLPVFGADKAESSLPNHSYNPTSLHPTLLIGTRPRSLTTVAWYPCSPTCRCRASTQWTQTCIRDALGRPGRRKSAPFLRAVPK